MSPARWTPLLRKALHAAASRRLSAGLLAVLVLYSGFLLAWSLLSPPAVVLGISRGWPYRIEYLLIGINTLCCIAVFWRPGLARCRRYRLDEAVLDGTPSSFLLDGAGDEVARRLAAALRRRGYRVRWLPDGALFAVRGR